MGLADPKSSGKLLSLLLLIGVISTRNGQELTRTIKKGTLSDPLQLLVF